MSIDELHELYVIYCIQNAVEGIPFDKKELINELSSIEIDFTKIDSTSADTNNEKTTGINSNIEYDFLYKNALKYEMIDAADIVGGVGALGGCAPDYLSKLNEHPRDKFIVFFEEGHKYVVNGKTDFTSTTTWIHSHFSHFNADSVIKNILKSKRYRTDITYPYYMKTHKEIKDSWDVNGKDASSRGTLMHYNIECYFNKLEVENDSLEYQYFKNFLSEIVLAQGLEAYRTEWLVYDELIKISGSIDMVFKRPDGDYEIYDWKRSKEIKYEDSFNNKTSHNPLISHLNDSNFWHYSLQLNCYKAILERNYGIRVVGLYLVILHPDAPNYQRIETADLQREIGILFKQREIMFSGAAVAAAVV